MFFASDNSSGVPEQVLASLARANDGFALGYGADEVMTRVRTRIREIFEAPEAAIYLVATGTAANALALATFCTPWGAVYCHRIAHIEEDECGAPEFYTGGSKLVLMDGPDGRMDPAVLAAKLDRAAAVGVHNVQKGMLSLTNLTEAGARYSVADIRALCDIAKAHNLPVHLDGARFTNALVAEGCTPAEMTWRAGVDVVSFGGTKNGLMGVEAVVIFDPVKAWEFELRRKRGGHLFSKHRFLSAQMEGWLDGDLWLDLARHANAMAERLEAGLARIPGARLLHPRGGNMVFAEWPRAGHRAAQDAGARYYFWPFDQSLEGPGDAPVSARLVASWSTTEGHVDRFLDLIST
ncbi:beta-eliminating lyase-related protein [Pararhodobacter sp. SW119]|uniref:threonine aldolase family protein n=1 Tax=Pararhodobacter sp. SW119 TaxID=2780075 RepID=UPI001AE06594|nr:beta-eliminating lyase-related protein [Pararhodobacter sp. SW119]